MWYRRHLGKTEKRCTSISPKPLTAQGKYSLNTISFLTCFSDNFRPVMSGKGHVSDGAMNLSKLTRKKHQLGCEDAGVKEDGGG